MLMPVEFTETQVESFWFEFEFEKPEQPLVVQLENFLSKNPDIKIVSMTCSEKTGGFFTHFCMRRLIVIFEKADPK